MTIIGNGNIVSRDPDCPFIENGGVAFEGPVIRDVGTGLREKYPGAEYIDARGRLVMPGFINTHLH